MIYNITIFNVESILRGFDVFFFCCCSFFFFFFCFLFFLLVFFFFFFFLLLLFFCVFLLLVVWFSVAVSFFLSVSFSLLCSVFDKVLCEKSFPAIKTDALEDKIHLCKVHFGIFCLSVKKQRRARY